jgi:hypothetical protein
LIHGEGFGAWCWYKTVALLEEVGLQPVALDLTGSGIDLTDSNNVTTLAEYSKPLTVYLENLPEDEKVQLSDIEIKAFIVVHSFMCIFHKNGNFGRLFLLVIASVVLAFLMHWNTIHTRSQKRFSFVLQW